MSRRNEDGRRVEQLPENYNREAFRAWNDRSRENLAVETIDLVQLHCPPDAVYESDAVFAALDDMVSEGGSPPTASRSRRARRRCARSSGPALRLSRSFSTACA